MSLRPGYSRLELEDGIRRHHVTQGFRHWSAANRRLHVRLAADAEAKCAELLVPYVVFVLVNRGRAATRPYRA